VDGKRGKRDDLPGFLIARELKRFRDAVQLSRRPTIGRGSATRRAFPARSAISHTHDRSYRLASKFFGRIIASPGHDAGTNFLACRAK
jgi:hypothetical protein